MRRCVIANQHTLFVSPERVTFGKLDPIRGYALLLQSSRGQFVEVRVAFLATVPSANQTVVRQNDQRRAAFTIKLRRPVSAFEISGRYAEDRSEERRVGKERRERQERGGQWKERSDRVSME